MVKNTAILSDDKPRESTISRKDFRRASKIISLFNTQLSERWITQNSTADTKIAVQSLLFCVLFYRMCAIIWIVPSLCLCLHVLNLALVLKNQCIFTTWNVIYMNWLDNVHLEVSNRMLMISTPLEYPLNSTLMFVVYYTWYWHRSFFNSVYVFECCSETNLVIEQSLYFILIEGVFFYHFFKQQQAEHKSLNNVLKWRMHCAFIR